MHHTRTYAKEVDLLRDCNIVAITLAEKPLCLKRCLSRARPQRGQGSENGWKPACLLVFYDWRPGIGVSESAQDKGDSKDHSLTIVNCISTHSNRKTAVSLFIFPASQSIVGETSVPAAEFPVFLQYIVQGLKSPSKFLCLAAWNGSERVPLPVRVKRVRGGSYAWLRQSSQKGFLRLATPLSVPITPGCVIACLFIFPASQSIVGEPSVPAAEFPVFLQYIVQGLKSPSKFLCLAACASVFSVPVPASGREFSIPVCPSSIFICFSVLVTVLRQPGQRNHIC
ncbi:uncharacterized protein LOC115480944 [Microcaecilia unicolor]|uniref:Uncharacterized protein LOC115480944 n=1 Tax=Microcaecilia unicolor TaxID=1415580 RepID=A0A6P7ZDF5_9AMPH|nr:uncharacterized protein LOC115480944 [Microcaecilia unicolor]